MTPEERAKAVSVGLCRMDAISGSGAIAAFLEKELAREIRDVVAEEREACDQAITNLLHQHKSNDDFAKGLAVAAAAIRARWSLKDYLLYSEPDWRIRA